MPSTKYPDTTLPVPWITEDDPAPHGKIIYPNWRGEQRKPVPDPLPMEADEKVLWDYFSTGVHLIPENFHMDFGVIEYLRSIEGRQIPACVLIQDYFGESITLIVCSVSVQFSPGMDKLPKLFFTYRDMIDGTRSCWGPLVLHIFPVIDSAPHVEETWNDGDLDENLDPARTRFFDILHTYGIDRK